MYIHLQDLRVVQLSLQASGTNSKLSWSPMLAEHAVPLQNPTKRVTFPVQPKLEKT